MKTLKLLSILSFIILASCSNDDDNNQPDNRQAFLVSESTVIGTYDYVYDDQNRHTQTVFTHISDPNNNYVYTVETFDSESRVLQTFTDYATGNDSREIYYYLPNGKVEKIETYSVDNLDNSTHIIDYLFEYVGNVINLNLYIVASDLELVYSETTLNPQGNVLVSKAYNPFAGTIVFQFDYHTYDDKKHPHSMLQLDVFETISANNVMSSTNSNFSTGDVTNYQYTYEYNAQGYPTKKTQVSPTGSEITIYTYNLR